MGQGLVKKLLGLAGLLVFSTAAKATASGYVVQLASFRSQGNATSGWESLKVSHFDLLGQLEPNIERANLGPARGIFFRLQVGPFEAEVAEALCLQLRARNQDCLLVWSTQSQPIRNTPQGIAETASQPAPPPGRAATADSPPRSELEASNNPGETPAVGRPLSEAASFRSEDPAPSRIVMRGQAPAKESGPRRPKGYVQGVGGITFGTELDRFSAAGFGFNLTPAVQIVLETGYMQNILPQSEQKLVDEIAKLLGQALEARLTIDEKLPVFYGMAGVRLLGPTEGRAHLYLTGGFGYAAGRRDLRYRAYRQDITPNIRVLGFPTESEDTSAYLFALGGGVNLRHGTGVSFDMGYRYMRFLDPINVNVNRAYVALGYAF